MAEIADILFWPYTAAPSAPRKTSRFRSRTLFNNTAFGAFLGLGAASLAMPGTSYAADTVPDLKPPASHAQAGTTRMRPLIFSIDNQPYKLARASDGSFAFHSAFEKFSNAKKPKVVSGIYEITPGKTEERIDAVASEENGATMLVQYDTVREKIHTENGTVNQVIYETQIWRGAEMSPETHRKIIATGQEAFKASSAVIDPLAYPVQAPTKKHHPWNAVRNVIEGPFRPLEGFIATRILTNVIGKTIAFPVALGLSPFNYARLKIGERHFFHSPSRNTESNMVDIEIEKIVPQEEIDAQIAAVLGYPLPKRDVSPLVLAEMPPLLPDATRTNVPIVDQTGRILLAAAAPLSLPPSTPEVLDSLPATAVVLPSALPETSPLEVAAVSRHVAHTSHAPVQTTANPEPAPPAPVSLPSQNNEQTLSAANNPVPVRQPAPDPVKIPGEILALTAALPLAARRRRRRLSDSHLITSIYGLEIPARSILTDLENQDKNPVTRQFIHWAKKNAPEFLASTGLSMAAKFGLAKIGVTAAVAAVTTSAAAPFIIGAAVGVGTAVAVTYLFHRERMQEKHWLLKSAGVGALGGVIGTGIVELIKVDGFLHNIFFGHHPTLPSGVPHAPIHLTSPTPHATPHPVAAPPTPVTSAPTSLLNVKDLLSSEQLKQLPLDLQKLAASQNPKDVMFFCQTAASNLLHGPHHGAAALEAVGRLTERGADIANSCNLHGKIAEQLNGNAAYMEAWNKFGVHQNIGAAIEHAKHAGHVMNNYSGRLLNLLGKQVKVAVPT